MSIWKADSVSEATQPPTYARVASSIPSTRRPSQPPRNTANDRADSPAQHLRQKFREQQAEEQAQREHEEMQEMHAAQKRSVDAELVLAVATPSQSGRGLGAQALGGRQPKPKAMKIE